MDNLLTNAIKFTDADGRIEVNVDRHGGALRVSVVDHGPGIPKDFHKHVFEVFAQADSSSRRGKGGVGLGLICKSIIEAHGGRIGFTSKAGLGTTFYFDLPLTKSDWKVSPKRPLGKASRQRPGAIAESGQRI